MIVIKKGVDQVAVVTVIMLAATSILLVGLGLLTECCSTAYITQPVSLNTSLNSTVTFTCEATGVSLINFYVNETVAAQQSIVNKGFTELGQVTINGTITRRLLSVYAQKINNNTNISCFTSPGDIISDNATLRIQGKNISLSYIFPILGPLASVSDLNYIILNGSSVLLSWTAPYTLDNVPITGYYINDNITSNNTNITISATDPDPCVLTNISVAAINGAGIGQINNISFYYQRG